MLLPTSQQMQRNACYQQVMQALGKEQAGNRYKAYAKAARSMRHTWVAWWFFIGTIVMLGMLFFFLSVIAQDTRLMPLILAVALAVGLTLWRYHVTSLRLMKWALASTGVLVLADVTGKKEAANWWELLELQYSYKDHLGITRKAVKKIEQYRFFWQQQPYVIDKGMKLVVAYDPEIPVNHVVLTTENSDVICFSDIQYDAYQALRQDYQRGILPERIYRIQQIIVGIIGVLLGFPLVFMVALIILKTVM